MKRAVIVGAGVGGLTAAIALRAIGWEVSIFERWPQINAEGTALGLRPDAHAGLAALGLGERLRERTVPYRRARIRTPRGRHLADLPLGRIEGRGGAPVRMLSRVALIEMLLEEVDRSTISTGVEPAGVRETLDDLRAHYAGWHDPIPRLLAAADDDSVLRHEVYDAPPLTSYVTANVALVGDAAHAMTPALGQGACQALLDAIELAACLREHPGDVAPALRAYDARRRPAAQRIVTVSRWMTRLAGSARLAGPRDALMRLLPV
ncbi:hypothetical protein C1I98_35535 [Spongiactinospora gelatinilytica]|uniref:FAD-binding domain-containing protein n=1 Tax=Spongiactinospora gelatinilytica TaxID=2666298 RepID=A0A2W2FIL5_9ACTN|nr:FAD-dependent monooxygenase [Spongiactinospora gelatinilytica]PZG24518.1 hypothetical protein C1I98_35535 [Spongiactinospora gelatinilytica]